ncbi:MAG: phosphopantetheine-binding protein [Verrucomicrobiota bacterium]
MNESETILNRIREQISESLGIDSEEVHHHSRLVQDLGAESIDLIDLVFRFEIAFDMKLPENFHLDEVRQGRGDLTVQMIAEDIEQRLSA